MVGDMDPSLTPAIAALLAGALFLVTWLGRRSMERQAGSATDTQRVMIDNLLLDRDVSEAEATRGALPADRAAAIERGDVLTRAEADDVIKWLHRRPPADR